MASQSDAQGLVLIIDGYRPNSPIKLGRHGFFSMFKTWRASCLALIFCGAALSLAGAAATPNVSTNSSPQQRFSAALAAFHQAQSDPERLVALYRLESQCDLLVNQRQILPTLRQLEALQGSSPLISAEVRNLIAAQLMRQGEVTQAVAVRQQLAYLTHWRAVGPFDNSNPDAIDTVEGPEKDGYAPNKTYNGKQGKVSWRVLPFPLTGEAENLSLYFTPAKSASVYLLTWVHSAAPQNIALRLQDSGAVRLWVNRQLLFQEHGWHSSVNFDMHSVAAHLVAGWNEILVKVGDHESHPWDFAVRLTTPSGRPLQLPSDLGPHVLPAVNMAQRKPALRFTVADLTSEAKQQATTPGGRLLYAWIIAQKSNFNAGDDSATVAFERAIAQQPNDVQALLDFARHDSDESRRYRNLERVLALDPQNTEALTGRGWIELERREFWPARQDFENVLKLQGGDLTASPRAALGRFEAYAGGGVRAEALRIAGELWASHLNQAPAVASGVSGALQRLGYPSQALRWSLAALNVQQNNPMLSLRAANLQRQQGNFLETEHTLAGALRLNPSFPYLMELHARLLQGTGHTELALNEMLRAAELDPYNPELRARLGDMRQWAGQREGGIREWRDALSLNPQDSVLRERLQLLETGATAQRQFASFEAPYAVSLASALKGAPAARKMTGNSIVVLAQTDVTQVFPSGNIGSYVERIYQINDQNGAQALSSYSVTYDPGTQSVRYTAALVRHPDGSIAYAAAAQDAPVSEAVGYETFYDVRNKYVILPNISPGDVVEIAYRIMPSTLESLYGDYYGDTEMFQNSYPKQFQQYVVLVPSDKTLYYKTQRFQGKQQIQLQGGNRVFRWSMRNVPAVYSEPDAPPLIESVPSVTVSMFRNWRAFGDWYRGLIRDEFVTDHALDETTDNLVKGLTSERQKVAAIYNWVISNTHYVALEFGIHGYRPYPVTQVFQRRFGDCKDKASLLIAMLARAGVPADLVITRTRDLGLPDPDIASVADFNHAIVYVPSLKLYLDGTTEYNGMYELPDGDQRAFVFRLPVLLARKQQQAHQQQQPGGGVSRGPLDGPGYAPNVTPELPPQQNSTQRVVEGTLDRAGNLDFNETLTVSGSLAPIVRGSLRIPSRQAGALQNMLSSRLPGISITSVQASGLGNFNQPALVRFSGSIPNFAQADGAGTLMLNRQMMPVSWLSKMASLSQRATPVLLSPPQTVEETLRITLPSGSQVSLPTAVHLENQFAAVQATASLVSTQGPPVLVIESVVTTKTSTIPVASYSAFRAFWLQVNAALSRRILVRLPPAQQQ